MANFTVAHPVCICHQRFPTITSTLQVLGQWSRTFKTELHIYTYRYIEATRRCKYMDTEWYRYLKNSKNVWYYVHIQSCVYVYIYIYMYKHTYIHTYTLGVYTYHLYIYIYTYYVLRCVFHIEYMCIFIHVYVYIYIYRYV